jgi:hypothetical protein
MAAVALLIVISRMLPHGRDHQPATAAAAAATASPPAEEPPQAAVRILSTYTRFTRLDANKAEGELRGLATSRDADRLAAQLHDDMARLARGYPGGPTVFWVGALATRSTTIDPTRTRVEIWFARVVAPPRLPAYVEWRLGRLELARERGDWRLAAFDDLPGPRPATVPGEADATAGILAALDGFAEVRP